MANERHEDGEKEKFFGHCFGIRGVVEVSPLRKIKDFPSGFFHCNKIGTCSGRKINFYPYLHPSFAGALGACYRAYVVNPAIRAPAKTSQSGGTGRRARLKIVYLRVCGFDSHLWY